MDNGLLRRVRDFSQEGFIVRTQRGRVATEKSYKHLGIKKEPEEDSLF